MINFTYDSAGNMTAANSTSYQGDAANRLQSVNNGSLGSYGYDGNGKRVKKTESGTTTYYVISSVLGSVLEVTSAGVQRAYVMSGSAVVAQLNPNGSFYWLHLDHLGSGRKMTDASGNMVYRAEFDPYGKLLFEWSSPSNLNTRKFTGYERDSATNLDYAQARIYGSEWGRFLSPDPAGMRVVNPTSPQSLNRYSYTDNNPVNRIDPTGEEWRIWIDLGASAEWLCRLGLEIFCDFSRTKAGGSGGGGGGADGRGLGIGVVVPIPTPAEAGIIFRRATDTATGISSTPNMLGRAKITFPAGPDKGFCKSGSEYTLFVEFEWTDIEEFIDPIKITGNGVKIIEVKGGRNSNVSYGRGDITIRWSWEGDNQLPDKRTIRIRLEGRTKPGYLDRTREATLFVDYDCKPS